MSHIWRCLRVKKYYLICLIVACFIPLRFVHAADLLVDTTWLAKNLTSKHLAIIDMSDDIQYERFHIPGAKHLPYSALNGVNKKKVSVSVGSETVMAIMGFLGIDADKHIVVYDDMGGLHASRLFWELERIGHKQVSILDGGLVKWVLEGHRVTAAKPKTVKTTYAPSAQPPKQNLAELDDISAKRDKNIVLLDVRSKEEYIGHPRVERSGHIPGAKWWHWEDNVRFDQAFTMKPVKTLQSELNKLGLTDKNKPIIAYCRSGHRASHSYFILRRLGYNNVRLYDASMAEYGQFTKLPLSKGME